MKKKEVNVEGFWRGVLEGGFFGGETDLRSGEFDRFGRYLDGDEELLL